MIIGRDHELEELGGLVGALAGSAVHHHHAPSRELALEAARRVGVTSDRVVEIIEGRG